MGSDFWIRFADGRPADSVSLVLLADAAAPVAFEVGAFGGATVELTVHIRARPAPGWIACRKQTRFLLNGYFEEDCETSFSVRPVRPLGC